MRDDGIEVPADLFPWLDGPTTIRVERAGIGWWLHPSDREWAWFALGTRAHAERVARRKLRRLARFDARTTFTAEGA